MADLKTSQEVSGVTLAKADEIRIARSGSNYKLRGDELLEQTIDWTDLQTLISTSDLVVGKKYRVTGLNSFPIIVEAVSPNGISDAAHFIENTWNDFDGFGIFDYANDTLRIKLTANGNILHASESVSYGNGTLNNYIQLSNIINPNSNGIGNNFIFNCGINILGTQINYSNLSRVVITDDSNANQIVSCNISDCTIQLLNGATLENCTIIGKGITPTQYVFDGVTLSGETIIAGVSSSVTRAITKSIEYNATTKVITLPPYCDYVGTFLLSGFANADHVAYIDTATNNYTNYVTPVKFQDAGNIEIHIDHIDKPSDQTTNFEIMFPYYAKTQTTIDTPYSYIKGIYDSGNALWVITEVTNYK